MPLFSHLSFTSRFTSSDPKTVKLFKDVLELELAKLDEFSSRVTNVSIALETPSELVISVDANDFIAYKTAVSSLLRFMEVISGTVDLIETGS